MSQTENTYIIQESAEGMRLDRWLCKQFTNIPYIAWVKLCRKGSVRLNGKRVKGGEHLKIGDQVRVPPTHFLNTVSEEKKNKSKQKKIVSQKDIDLFQSLIIHEDDNLLCINKPSGLASQGGTNIKKSVDALAVALGAQKNIHPKLLHRLDRDTSGFLMLAKNDQTARKMGKKLKEGQIEKFYVAFLKGVPHPLQSRIIAPIEKGISNDKEKMIVSESGKKTVTDYDIIEHLGKRVSVALLAPQTGRTHQLRVHMAYLGTPIIGDFKYGEGEYLNCDCLCLHAYTAKAPGIPKNIRCSFPPHMKKALSELGINEKELTEVLRKRIDAFSKA